jgi:hypothetical protein
LSKAAGEKGLSVVARPLISRATRSFSRVNRSGGAGPEEASRGESNQTRVDAHEGAPPAGNGATGEAMTEGRARAVRRRGRKTKDGLPEGWVIDEDGFVVPRQG